MDNQVFDEGAGPALGDSDNVVPLIDRKETKVGGKLIVISKAGPPLFKCPNVAAALSVADLKQAMNRRRIASGKRPHAITGRATRWGDRFSQVASQALHLTAHALGPGASTSANLYPIATYEDIP
jgi:hypothetical protein